MVAITAHTEGSVIAVRAQPGARKTRVIGEQAGALKVAVTAPADQGRANEALVEFLRQVLAVKRSQVVLLRGETSRQKQFLVRAVTPEELRRRVAEILAKPTG